MNEIDITQQLLYLLTNATDDETDEFFDKIGWVYDEESGTYSSDNKECNK